MVQYKRKPVIYKDRSSPPPRRCEVWPIWQTNEIFTDYDSYLRRLDYYRRKKFTCEITGHTGLTFFEAQDSEMDQAEDLDTSFPEKLREPVLRKAQFSTIGRINDLVSHIYSELDGNFFPGEWILYVEGENKKLEGVVRGKVNISARLNSDGSVRGPMARYTVEPTDGGPDLHAEPGQLLRERRIFNKQMLRSFLKGSLQREAWQGAPWLVKPSLAETFKITTEIPRELQYEVKMAERKQLAAMKLEAVSHQQSSANHAQTAASNAKVSKHGALAHLAGPPCPIHDGKPPSPQQATCNDCKRALSALDFGKNGVMPKLTKAQILNASSNSLSVVIRDAPSMPPPPPPIKYPIEDLDVKPKPNSLQRPPLSFMVDDPPLQKPLKPRDRTGLEMRSMGPLLEIWNTLNVLCEVFILDSFTFDDFVGCMLFSSDDVTCELFAECHCAVLKQLVDEKGDLQVYLPEFDDESDEDEGDSDEEGDEDEDNSGEEKAPDAEPDTPPRRTTRSSLAKEELLRKKSATPESEGPTHLAAEMQGERDWIERLKVRDFRDGGWQVIMVGLLNQMALSPREEQACEEILTHLAPVDMEPTQETARMQYVTLDVNQRVVALEIVCMLSIRTKAVRGYLEQCSEQMTDLRKEKIEMQRKRKPLVEELREMDEQRKILLPENMPASPPPETNGAAPKTNGVHTNGTLNGDAESSPDTTIEVLEDDAEAMDTDDDEDVPRRGLRGGVERINERKRKRDDEIARKEKEKRDRLEASKAGKQSPAFRKLLREIEKKKDAIKKCEDAISEYDSDLREANCQRTKVLGRDRYCYRYYWYERNGMPFGGLPNSSTAESGYANGRLWIQGPDDMEREGFIDLPEDLMKEHVEKIGMTVDERRKQDEGDTRLLTAQQWGYIDDPDAVDGLIAWLDERGRREKQLRKELIAWRDPIVSCMRKMDEHLRAAAERRAGAAEDPAARVSTRNKTYVDIEAAIAHPCLLWENRYAKYEINHLHSMPPKPKAPRKGRASGGSVAAAEKASAAAAAKSSRSGKQRR